MARRLLALLGGLGLLFASLKGRAASHPEPETPPTGEEVPPGGWQQIEKNTPMFRGQSYDYASLLYGPKAIESLALPVRMTRRWYAGGGIVTTFLWDRDSGPWSPPAWFRQSGYLRAHR